MNGESAFLPLKSFWNYAGAGSDRILQSKERAIVWLIHTILPKWVTPNMLTNARLVCAILIICILSGLFSHAIDPGAGADTVIMLFTAAVLTDLFDGPLARTRNLVTEKGAKRDPLYDKILILPLVVYFLWSFDALLVALVVSGEIFSQGARYVGFAAGHDMSANALGKWKMVAQTIGIYLLFLGRVAYGDRMLWFSLGLGLASLSNQARLVFFGDGKK